MAATESPGKNTLDEYIFLSSEHSSAAAASTLSPALHKQQSPQHLYQIKDAR